MRNFLDLHGKFQPMLYILVAKYRPWISKLLAKMQTKYSRRKIPTQNKKVQVLVYPIYFKKIN